VGTLIERGLASAPGRDLLSALRPEDDDYVVLKPKHSAFFSTPLDTLLRYLRVETLLITGLTTDICVLFTANDAFLRDFRLVVPEDCVTAVEAQDHQQALGYMRRVLHADTCESDTIDVASFMSSAGSRRSQ
jgi:nicotinamidase-related amidase